MLPSGAANAESLGGSTTPRGQAADGKQPIRPTRVACPLG